MPKLQLKIAIMTKDVSVCKIARDPRQARAVESSQPPCASQGRTYICNGPSRAAVFPPF